MPIQIPRSRISANVGQRHRPVDTSVAGQVQMEGFANLAGIGKGIYDAFAEASLTDADKRVEADIASYKLKYNDNIRKAKTFEEARNITMEFEEGWNSFYEGSVSKAREGVLLGSRGIYDNKINRSRDLEAIGVNDYARRTATAFTQNIVQDAIQEQIQNGSFDEAIKNAKKNEVLLGVNLRNQLIAAAQKTRQVVTQKNAENEAGEYFRNMAIADGGDWSRAILASTDPAVQKELGIDLAASQKIIQQQQTIASAQKKIVEDVKTQEQYQTFTEAFVSAGKNSLSPTTVFDLMSEGRITVEQGRAVIAAIDAPAKTNIGSYANIDELVSNFTLDRSKENKQAVMDEIMRSSSSKKLSTEDAETFIDRLGKESNKAIEHDFVFARDAMKGLLLDQDDLDFDYQFITDDRKNIAYSESVLRLRDFVTQAQTDKRHLSQRDITVKATSIALEIKERVKREAEIEKPVTIQPLEKETVIVLNPDGVEGTILKSDLEQALKEGYRQK